MPGSKIFTFHWPNENVKMKKQLGSAIQLGTHEEQESGVLVATAAHRNGCNGNKFLCLLNKHEKFCYFHSTPIYPNYFHLKHVGHNQSADFHNPLMFRNSPLAQQVFVVVIDNGGGSDSEQKDKLDTYKVFRKFLVLGFTCLQ